MIKKLNANKILSLSLFGLALFFLINPKVCSNSCISGITVWALNVFPVLFPFFILTRLIVKFNNDNQSRMDKYFSKFYNSPSGSLQTFLLSLISGYPMGVKLISNAYNDGKISTKDAEKMLSFCSIAGPMFIIGTIGFSIVKNYLCGIIILISNILSALLNGIIFSKFNKKNITQKPTNAEYKSNKINTTFGDIVYDSLISVLMVGAYIALSFIVIEILKMLGIFNILSNVISFVFKANKGTINAFLIGLIEITKGSIEIASLPLNLAIKTTLISGIVGFGGLSVLLQSLSFLKNLKINVKNILLQKIVQGLISFFIAFILTLIIKC